MPPEFVLLKPANLRVVSKLGLTQCPHSPLHAVHSSHCNACTLCVVQVSKLGPDGVEMTVDDDDGPPPLE